MFKPGSDNGNGHGYSAGQRDYELLEGGQGRLNSEGEWACLGKLPGPLAWAARKLGITSRQSLWRNVLPVVTLFLSATLFILVSVSTLRYLKLSGIYLPSYRHIPPVSQAQIEAATSRHLTNDQCIDLYPGLFE